MSSFNLNFPRLNWMASNQHNDKRYDSSEGIKKLCMVCFWNDWGHFRTENNEFREGNPNFVKDSPVPLSVVDVGFIFLRFVHECFAMDNLRSYGHTSQLNFSFYGTS